MSKTPLPSVSKYLSGRSPRSMQFSRYTGGDQELPLTILLEREIQGKETVKILAGLFDPFCGQRRLILLVLVFSELEGLVAPWELEVHVKLNATLLELLADRLMAVDAIDFLFDGPTGLHVTVGVEMFSRQ